MARLRIWDSPTTIITTLRVDSITRELLSILRPCCDLDEAKWSEVVKPDVEFGLASPDFTLKISGDDCTTMRNQSLKSLARVLWPSWSLEHAMEYFEKVKN